ncbi:nucleotidyltransferase [Anaerocolumna cellulosilytica]|uniref:Nucleotidyltransferase n=1 Tax=Anaerocolumna cellulosilytica TaxID=433286 RepID=A0A6S6QZP3_9FIRM|nr:sugar phosphate nucleotidyltransferase [Anaerocolumna cellulosilytica]MBB5195171.1 dTDP-glucose pyrophosphorylase [Anaerocolumna cellulosilytica]BCJ96643.1 nucleotidyltransferase [Anaerocolumna cellulosilytica]
MTKTTLVIMAAGLGSRYGGIKQLEPVGPSGEIIMDYSIYDAIKAGFNKVVFIIRKDLEADFKDIIGNRIAKHVEVDYVFQELDNLPEGFTKPEERTKPWGTGQAVLSCEGILSEPFAVINADDYYGKEAFEKVHDFLVNADSSKLDFCMAGFILGNTLSENGSVTRGVCRVNEKGLLTDIVETKGIEQKGNAAVAVDEKGEEITIDLNGAVSMNMWGFTPGLLAELKEGFISFLKVSGQELKSEYLLPEMVGNLIHAGKATVQVLQSKDKWFGVTYKEDKPVVVDSFKALIKEGLYPEKLF